MTRKPIILHVDDDEANRYAVRLILERAGYEIIEAENGEEGLKRVHELPDLIILDIRLPDINGFEICRRIKANPDLFSIPVLQTSASFISSQNKVEGLESGADGYLAQPIEAAVLVATVRSLLRIRNAEKEAQAAKQGRDEMMAIVSHDLRNPLAAIMLQVKLMKKLYLEKGQIQDLPEKLDRIGKSCGRINRLIEDLLDVSNIEGGSFKLAPVVFSANDLVKDTLTSFEELAHQSNVQLQFNDPGEVVETVADRDRIQQVLQNLLSNAIKFTPENGSVSVALETKDKKTIFQVRDTGRGIDPQNMSHIFDRYWQGLKGGREGVGLGLSIVKGIIDAHGGEISVESSLDQGTTFSFSLPQ